MIYMYTGTPGSGKTLHATKKVDFNLRIGRNVIANYGIKYDVKHHRGEFVYRSNEELTVKYLVNFARKNHDPQKMSQTVIVIDEAHIMFNSRGYNVAERMKWLIFLSCHRKLGYDIIMITQSDKAIDLQVRGLIEFNIKHRLNESYGIIGWLIAHLTGLKFVAVKYWYVIDEKCGHERFGINKRIANMYDTFVMFNYDDLLDELDNKASKLIPKKIDSGGEKNETV